VDLSDRVVDAMRVMLYVVALAIAMTYGGASPGLVVLAVAGISLAVAVFFLRRRSN
jgi:hypothetical protein